MPKRIFTLIVALIMTVLPMSACFDGEPNVQTKPESADSSSEEAVTTAQFPKEENEIMLNGSIPCGYTAAKYGYMDSSNFKDKALNYTGEDQKYYTPWIFKAESVDELKAVFELMRNPSGINAFRDDSSEKAYNSLYGNYTDAYFEENALLIIYLAAGSGGDAFAVSSVTIAGNALTIGISQTEYGVTDDMSGWLFRIAIPKSAVEGITEYIAE